jgi:hypothetical protein
MSDGGSVAEHSASAARQWAAIGKKVKIAAIDDVPECPTALTYLWGYFCEILSGLASNGFGPAVVTWEALAAWSAFMRIALEPWEARALVELGAARASIEAEALAKRRPKERT